MFCNKCGQKLSDDSLFCQHCGNKIDRQLISDIDLPVSQSLKADKIENRNEFKYPSGTKSCWIIGVLLLLSYIQVWHPYAESEYYDYASLLGAIDFCLLNLIMMPLPMFLGVLKSNLTPRKIKILCAANSIIAFVVSLLLVAAEIISAMFIGWIVALFYYFINSHILLQIKKHSCDKKKCIIAVISVFFVIIAMFVGGVNLFNHIAEENIVVVDGTVNTSEETSVDELVGDVSKTLVVAVEEYFPPFSYKEDDGYRGIHIDMAEEMARRLNVDLAFVPAEFSEIVYGVDKGLFDLAFGIQKTPERAEVVMFTEPYFEEMSVIFRGETFEEYAMITLTLEEMIEDGTVNNIFSNYDLYFGN